MSDKDHRDVASHVLKTAHKVVTTERGNQHGGAEDSFRMIADLWQTYLRNTGDNQQSDNSVGKVWVSAYDVAQMMTLLKVARAVHGNPTNEDNYVDAAGYQSLAAAIAGVKPPLVTRPATPGYDPISDAEEQAVKAMATALAPLSGSAKL